MVNQVAENNLYQLFKAVGSIGKVEYFDDPQSGFSCIKKDGFEWPNMSFIQPRQNSHFDFSLVVDKIKAQVFPRLFIFNQSIVDDKAFAGHLNEHKFIIAGRWVDMHLELQNFNNHISEREFVEIKDYKMVCSWTEVVSQSLFKGKVLDAGFFHKGMEMGIFRLFAIIFDNRIVATSMAFVSSSDDPGIYMVSTHPDYRKRGFGYEIMCFTLNELKNQGLRKAVLQSTTEGLPLYSKIGFIQNSLLPLYFCLIR